MKNMKKKFLLSSVVLFVFLLSGCQALDTPLDNDAPPTPPPAVTPTANEKSPTADATIVAAAMTGVTMKDGKMMTMWEGGESALMEKDLTMANGTIVKMTGEIVTKEGVSAMMKEGEKILKDGTMVKAAVDKTNVDASPTPIN